MISLIQEFFAGLYSKNELHEMIHSLLQEKANSPSYYVDIYCKVCKHTFRDEND